AGNQIFRGSIGKIFGARGLLGNRYVTGRLDKGRELFVRHFRLVHPETVHVDAVNGARVGHGVWPAAQRRARIVATHREFPPGNPDHSGWRLAGGSGSVLDGRQKRAATPRARFGIRLGRQPERHRERADGQERHESQPRDGRERRRIGLIHFLKSSPGSSGGPPYSLKLNPLPAIVTSPGIWAPSVRSRPRIAPASENFPANSWFFPPCSKLQVNLLSCVRLSANVAPSLRLADHLPTIFVASMSLGGVGSL